MSVTSANSRGGGAGIFRTASAHGSRRVDPLCVSRCISQNRKQTFVNNYTAKVGEAKYIENRQTDRPSCFFCASILAATGFRTADPRGVSRCIWHYRKQMKKHVLFDSCAAKIGKSKKLNKYKKTKVQSTWCVYIYLCFAMR